MEMEMDYSFEKLQNVRPLSKVCSHFFKILPVLSL